LDQLEELPTWTEWFEAIRSRIEMAMSLRTVQRHLKKLRGKTEPVTDSEVDPVGDDADDDTAESSPLAGYNGCGEVKSSAELLAEHIKQMGNVLAGKSIMSDGMRISLAAGLLKDMQRALEEGFLFDAPPVAEHEEVAVVPDKLDSSVTTLNADPEWKQALVKLMAVMEQFGDRLPLGVLKEMRKIELLLGGKEPRRPEIAAPSNTTKLHQKLIKLDEDGNRCRTVNAESDRNARGTFEIESDADDAIANLSSPVISLLDNPNRT
jgi:hypothetical protein